MSENRIGKNVLKSKPSSKLGIIRSLKGELLPPSTRYSTISLVKMLKKYKLKYIIVGAVPVQFYGRERFSRDVDIVLFLNEENVKHLFHILKLRRYQVIYPLEHEHKIEKPHDLLDWHLIKLKDRKTDSLVDIILKPQTVGLSFETLKRARVVTLDKEKIVIASPEDYLITKLKSRRPSTHDYEDIISTLVNQYELLDWNYLERRADNEGVLSLLNYYKEGIKKKSATP